MGSLETMARNAKESSLGNTFKVGQKYTFEKYTGYLPTFLDEDGNEVFVKGYELFILGEDYQFKVEQELCEIDKGAVCICRDVDASERLIIMSCDKVIAATDLFGGWRNRVVNILDNYFINGGAASTKEKDMFYAAFKDILVESLGDEDAVRKIVDRLTMILAGDLPTAAPFLESYVTNMFLPIFTTREAIFVGKSVANGTGKYITIDRQGKYYSLMYNGEVLDDYLGKLKRVVGNNIE